MKQIKLDDDTLYDCLYINPGEILFSGEKTLVIGIDMKEMNPIDIEEKFNNHSSTLKYGFKIDPINETDTISNGEFLVEQKYDGFTHVNNFLINRDYVYNINEKINLMKIVMQEPDLSKKLNDINTNNNDLMLALTQVYEMLLANNTNNN